MPFTAFWRLTAEFPVNRFVQIPVQMTGTLLLDAVATLEFNAKSSQTKEPFVKLKAQL